MQIILTLEQWVMLLEGVLNWLVARTCAAAVALVEDAVFAVLSGV